MRFVSFYLVEVFKLVVIAAGLAVLILAVAP